MLETIPAKVYLILVTLQVEEAGSPVGLSPYKTTPE
jgi:hypothetical protein